MLCDMSLKWMAPTGKSAWKSYARLVATTLVCYACMALAQEQGVRSFEKMKYGLFVHPLRSGNAATSGPAPGAARWFDATALRLTNGAPVTCWRDASGQEADAVCSPGVNRPPTFLADAGTGTGLGTVHFGPGSGKNPALNSEALVFRADTRIRTVFSVFKGSGFLLTDYGATRFHRPDDTNAAAQLWCDAYASPAILGGITYVNGAVVNWATLSLPTNLHHGFNLVEVITTNPVTASGFNKDRVCHAGDQHQGEVLIYDFPLDSAQRLRTEAYLRAKWFGERSVPEGRN